jgi:multidrug efflux pump subunit AcrB
MATLFFRNPRLLILTVSVILVAGLSAFNLLPRREDPELTPRNALLITRYPGADAERVEKLVTEKLEDVLDEFEEIKKTISTSRRGISTISIELHDHIMEVEPIWSEMRDDVAAVRNQLPLEASDPFLDDLDIDASTIIYSLSWSDPQRPPQIGIMQRYAEELADIIRGVPGTKETRLHGANPEEITVRIDPERLAAHRLDPDQVAQTLRAADSKIGAGRLLNEGREVALEVGGAFESLKQIRNLPLRYGEGDAILRLGDIATLAKGVGEPPRQLAFNQGRRTVAVAVLLESDARIDVWGAEVDAAVGDFRSSLPGSLDLEILFDQRRYTADRLDQLFANLGIGALLVCALVFFIMGWRSALVVGAALPLSSLCVLAGMRLLNIPIHQMSVTGLIIALGLLIDNAIVMTDAVRHRIIHGSSALEAVGASVRQLAVPLFGSTLTTILSFMPIALMPGPAGEFVGSIAVSVTLAIASSFVLALTVIPALSAALGRGFPREPQFLRGGFSWAPMTRLYGSALRAMLRLPALTILLALALPFAGFLGAGGLIEQFFPAADRDQFPIELRLDPQASIEETRRVAERARSLLLEEEGVEAVSWFLGASAPKFYYNMMETENDVPSFGHALVKLEGSEGAFAIMRRVQARLDQEIPEGEFLVRPLEQGPPFQAPIEIHVKGPDLAVLQGIGEDLRRELSEIPGVTHTRSTLARGLPLLHLEPREERANLIGLRRRDIARALADRLDGRLGGSLIEGREELPLRVRIGDDDRGHIDRIRSLELATRSADPEDGRDGNWTSLANLATLTTVPVPGDIEHKDGRRSNTIQGYLEAGRLPATVLEPLQSRLAHLDLPPGYELEIGGESEQRDRAVGNLMASVGVLLVLMVAVLVLSFGSFRLAGAIGGVGFLGVGLSLGALRLFDYPFGFMAIVGTMGLIGVAINDSIVVLAAIRDDERAREGDRRAIAEVTLHSTRHVVATTATTAAGFIPLMLDGGGFWPPVAVTIGGGVLGATLLALVFIPSIYALLHRPSPSSTAEPAAA